LIAVGLLLPANVLQDLPTGTLSPLSKLVIEQQFKALSLGLLQSQDRFS
jgi:hypothetical protein